MVNISLLDVYLSKEIPQNLLLTEEDFERYARERGVNVRQKDLEFFEELGLLFPLCRIDLPLIEEHRTDTGEIQKRYAPLFDISHNLSRWYEDGLCEDPVKEKFRPWKEYKNGYWETARALFHPWQFKNLRTVVNWLGYRISVPEILESQKLEKIREKVREFWGSEKDWRGFIAKRLTRDSRFLPFLLSIEDLYLPIVRSHFKGNISKPNIGFELWRQLKSKFNHKEALSKSAITVSELQQWRRQIAADAGFIDPLADWYLLVRHCEYDKKQKLKGDARFAQDLYEIIEVLGLFLEEITGESQCGPDDLLNGRRGEWKKSWYGADVDFANRDVLRKIAYEYGLDYDYKLLLFVEGETEFHAIPIIADALGISFARLGIRLEKLGGYSEIAPKRIERLLQYAQRNNMFAHIIIDNHEHSKRYVDELIIRHDLPVEESSVCVWNIDFEEDNFSVEELIEAAIHVASVNGMTLSITAEMIEAYRKSFGKVGVAEALMSLCEKQNFQLSKPDLGIELGQIVTKRIKEGQTETTKIETELIRMAKFLPP